MARIWHDPESFSPVPSIAPRAAHRLVTMTSAFVTTGVRLSGMTTGNTPPKNSHACSKPSITSGRGLSEGKPHEHVPGPHRNEYQCVHCSAPRTRRVEHYAHPPEVCLCLPAGLGVGQADRCPGRSRSTGRGLPHEWRRGPAQRLCSAGRSCGRSPAPMATRRTPSSACNHRRSTTFTWDTLPYT
jgi:hypothetical protein